MSTESEQSAGQGYPPTWQLRRHDIPVSLSMDTSVWWSSDLFSAMRTTLGADRSREHLEAHAAGDTVTNVHLRAEHVVDWATRGGARALGRDDLGSWSPGKKADVVLIKNDASPVSFPLLNPYGHVAFQAQRGDVHTVLVDGRVVKHDGHELVGGDLAAVRDGRRGDRRVPRGEMGEEAWQPGMNPALPQNERRSSTTRTSTPSTSPTSTRGPGARSSASRARGTARGDRGVSGRTGHGTGLRRGAGPRARRPRRASAERPRCRSARSPRPPTWPGRPPAGCCSPSRSSATSARATAASR